MKKLLIWTLLSSLFFFSSCTPAEKPASSFSGPGVYGYLPDFESDDAPATKAKFPVAEMNLRFEVGDKINIWSEVGTLLVYKVTETDGKSATFDGGGFTLTEGMKYYSSFPLIASARDDMEAISHSYENQVQTADGVADHVAEYTYVRSESTCTNGSTHFSYAHLSSWVRFFLTLPKNNMTITELTLNADSPVFALNGTVNIPAGTFTLGEMSNTMTLKLDNVTVTDGELNAYMAVNPFAAFNAVVRIKDSEGKSYVSVAEPQNALAVGKYRTIRTSVAAEDPTANWAKVTDPSELTTGTYAIVYPAADGYKLFSFEKTMANAQSAAALVADKHTFADVVPMRGQLFQTCVAGNYETIDVPADPNMLEIPVSLEPNFAISATTAVGEAGSGTAVLTSTSKNLGFESVIVALDSDYSATITAALDAKDFREICDYLRGHELKFAFTDVMDFVAQEVSLTASQKSAALDAFDKLCAAGKEELAEHGYTFGPIDHTTHLMDVFQDHYWYFADKSLGYDSDKAYGWLKPVGFYLSNDGFSARLPMPPAEWFDRIKASFAAGTKDGFIAYWQSVDPQYPRILDVFDTASFFGRLAQKMMATTTDAQFAQLAAVNWTAIGQKYQTYCDDICANDDLEKVFVYKKVE
ncbi:MAG: hypothetical protein IJS70_10290 [Bacteroidales bacterium]|nr:hypothetical protein [Bacteroidales bacterium]